MVAQVIDLNRERERRMQLAESVTFWAESVQFWKDHIATAKALSDDPEYRDGAVRMYIDALATYIERVGELAKMSRGAR